MELRRIYYFEKKCLVNDNNLILALARGGSTLFSDHYDTRNRRSLIWDIYLLLAIILKFVWRNRGMMLHLPPRLFVIPEAIRLREFFILCITLGVLVRLGVECGVHQQVAELKPKSVLK